MKKKFILTGIIASMLFTSACSLFSDGDIYKRKIVTLKENEKTQIANELASIVMSKDEKYDFIVEKLLDQIALTKDDKTVGQLRTQIEADKDNLYENYTAEYNEINKPKEVAATEKVVNIPFIDNVANIVKNIYSGNYATEGDLNAAISEFNADYKNAFKMIFDEKKTYNGLEYSNTFMTSDQPREYRADLVGTDKTVYVFFSEVNGSLNLSRIIAE